jgi:GNAT superfamily N-acetyltransferase
MIRRGSAADVPFLRDMLRHAYYWRWEDPEGIPASRYVEGWGRPGDTAVIALDEGFPVGAAWYRLFRRRAPGYGFVDESTPELTIAVVPSRRGRGLGEQLLAALLERARQEGHTTISLSVERANPARHLYERFGFEPVRETDNTLVMRADLTAAGDRTRAAGQPSVS